MSDLTFSAVRKSFGALEIVKGIDLAVKSGEFVVFVGPSGCGKSTLLRMVAGLESVSSGTIAIGGEDVTNVPPAERGIAMVFQSYALFPHMNVADNISFGMRLAHQPRHVVARRVEEVAEILQIKHLLHRQPKQLSGGQRQRVAIGRAIARQPKVFLFDEPLSNLDAALRVQLRVEIARLHAEMGATMVYVTHDQVEAMTLADRIVVLNQGQVEQIGTPLELYDKPASRFVAEFIGQPKMNILPARIASTAGGLATIELASGGSLQVPLAGPVAPGDPVAVGVRPDAFTLATDGAGDISGSVAVIEHLGAESIVYVAVPGTDELLSVKTQGRSPFQHGAPIALRIDPRACHLFDERGATLT